jgi:LuxR family transcriptional regulator, maltose regulon positive regulatory protein
MGGIATRGQIAERVGRQRSSLDSLLPVLHVLPSRLTPPGRRAGIVPRAALVDELRTCAAPVVAIVAPPGYGKTTILALWAAQDRRPFAWLSVDPVHNDPAVLLAYLASALAG